LVVAALLFAGTLRNLLAVDSGFDADHVLVARVDLSRADAASANRAALKREILERVTATAGVTSAAEVRHVPMAGTGSSLSVWTGADRTSSRTAVRLNAIGEGYLQTMGIPLVAGRDFTRHDSANSPRVALVNAAFVRRLGIAGNAIGASFRAEGSSATVVTYEIVGLVQDTKYFALREESLPIVFVPVTQSVDPRPVADVMIRSRLPLAAVAAAVRREMREVSAAIDVDVRVFASTIQQGLLRERLMAAISAFFAVLALVVAAIGLYGVLAELVTRRRGEIGVRLALGARRADIVSMVVGEAAALLALGLGTGATLAFATGGFAASLVFGLSPNDVRPIAVASVLLAAVGFVAVLVPAYRAAMLEPVTALREG
jgi:predicted permease